MGGSAVTVGLTVRALPRVLMRTLTFWPPTASSAAAGSERQVLDLRVLATCLSLYEAPAAVTFTPRGFVAFVNRLVEDSLTSMRTPAASRTSETLVLTAAEAVAGRTTSEAGTASTAPTRNADVVMQRT